MVCFPLVSTILLYPRIDGDKMVNTRKTLIIASLRCIFFTQEFNWEISFYTNFVQIKGSLWWRVITGLNVLCGLIEITFEEKWTCIFTQRNKKIIKLSVSKRTFHELKNSSQLSKHIYVMPNYDFWCSKSFYFITTL